MREREVGVNRCVATGDVEPDADDGHLVVIGGDTADRHHVPDVSVRHERGVSGARADVLELRERGGVVRAKDFHSTEKKPGPGNWEPRLRAECREATKASER